MSVLPTKHKVGTTAWAVIVAAPDPGKIRRVDLTATNITAPAAFAAASVQIVDAGDGSNSGVSKNAVPLPAPPDPDSTVILEYGLMLTAGQRLEVKASADNAISYRAETQEMAAADA